MVDLSKYDDKSIYNLATSSYSKINDNSFYIHRKYKRINSPEDCYVLKSIGDRILFN